MTTTDPSYEVDGAGDTYTIDRMIDDALEWGLDEKELSDFLDSMDARPLSPKEREEYHARLMKSEAWKNIGGVEGIDWKQDLDEKCSCGNTGPDPEDHEGQCNLFWSWDFDHGWAVWDDDSKQLIPVVPDGWENEADTVVDIKDSKPPIKTPFWMDQTWEKCRHYQDPLILPDGTVVYGSSFHRDREKDPIPDLGIYMDGIWDPDTVAFLVGCPDRGLPIPQVWQVLHIAREGLRMARAQHRVEIGCIGGHGRTGLMLGIMVLLAMENPDGEAAIKYVHNNYCKEAIETAEQEWYIKGIAAELMGQPWPTKPKPPPKPVYVFNDKHTRASIFDKDGATITCKCGWKFRVDDSDIPTGKRMFEVLGDAFKDHAAEEEKKDKAKDTKAVDTKATINKVYTPSEPASKGVMTVAEIKAKLRELNIPFVEDANGYPQPLPKTETDAERDSAEVKASTDNSMEEAF